MRIFFGINLGHMYNTTSDSLISIPNHSCKICCCLFPFWYHDTLWLVVLRCMGGIFWKVLNIASNLSLLHDIASNLCLLHDNASKPPFCHDMLWASNMHWLYFVFALLIDMSTRHAMWLIFVVKWLICTLFLFGEGASYCCIENTFNIASIISSYGMACIWVSSKGIGHTWLQYASSSVQLYFMGLYC